MNLFTLQGRAAARHPRLAVAALLVLTVAFSTGFGLTETAGDQVDAFLPESNPAAQAEATIATRFEGAAVGAPVQLVARGDVLEPSALAVTLEAATAVAADPLVAPLLASENAVTSYAHVVAALSPDRAVGELTRSEVDALVAAAPPELATALDQLVARDAEGNVVGGLGIVSLVDPDDFERVEAAELAAQTALDAVDTTTTGNFSIRTFSNGKLNQEINDSQGSTTSLLLGLALLVILALLVVFYRTGSDVALSMGGLVITVVWVFGLQGLLGPGGVDVIGASNPLATMVPVLLIGLTVDFALQITGKYREYLSAGNGPADAIAAAVKATGLPLFLAAVTTVISFFTNITNSLPPLRDFGIIAGLGVLGGYVVMTTFAPSMRSILDQRRAAAGKPVKSTLLADAIPGVGAATSAIAKVVVRRPLPVLIAVATVAIVAGLAAVNIDTTFSTTDFLPEDTEAYDDITFLEDSFGGGSATTTVLVRGDADDDKLVRDIVDFETALADPGTRPAGVTGPPRASTLTLVQDWSTDSGLPGDRFDQDFADYIAGLDLGFIVPDGTFTDLFDQLRRVDPDGLDRVLSLGEGDADDLSLIRVPTVSGDPEATRQLVSDLTRLWDGDPDQIQLTGQDILTVAVTDEMVDSQARSIVLTIVAALVVLVVFFGVTRFRPMLGVLAVLPIGLVVVAVLGTMVALGISYNVITALITALTIGVGVDYTIHVTHRFVDELEEHPDGTMLDAMTTVMRTTGAALIGSALTTALGFAVLVFSPLAPMQQFGLLTAVTIAYSLIGAFAVLPPMLVLWAIYHRWRASVAF